MQQTSALWAPALATYHGHSVRVNVLRDGMTVAEDIAYTDGQISVDRGSETRRSLSLTIPDPRDFPTGADDLYSVTDTRIQVEAGIRYADGTTEHVPAGDFVVTAISGDRHMGPLTITAPGLEAILRREVWESAMSTTGYGTPAGIIGSTILSTIPGSVFLDQTTGAGSGALATATWDANTDKWSALDAVAIAAGCELYCDAAGRFILADVPDPSTAAHIDWDVSAGASGVLVSADIEITSDEVYNRVVVTGENSSDDAPPVIGDVRIEDPADPLRYGGPYGRVTKTHSSNLVTTSAQAVSAANAMLRTLRAPNRSVTLSAVPNPALDAGDCIRVGYGMGYPAELHLVHSFTLPLDVGSGEFTITTIGGRDDS